MVIVSFTAQVCCIHSILQDTAAPPGEDAPYMLSKVQKILIFATFLHFPYIYIYIYIDKNNPSPACFDVRRPLEHMAVIYTVHKSHGVQSPALHPAVESFCTVRIFIYLFLTGRKKTLVYADPGLIRNDV